MTPEQMAGMRSGMVYEAVARICVILAQLPDDDARVDTLASAAKVLIEGHLFEVVPERFRHTPKDPDHA